MRLQTSLGTRFITACKIKDNPTVVEQRKEKGQLGSQHLYPSAQKTNHANALSPSSTSYTS